ncbi:MAG: dethiobiotin synthase [Verrucomicrobiales bacterium]|nr:dethiobiotin synthase [Verrucomicrobiales bacterium]
MRYFITGTDTDAGKTYVTCLLLQALNAAGKPAVGFKPICCGDRRDVMLLLAAGVSDDAGPALEEINPVFYQQPLAPLTAGWMANVPFDREGILKAWQALEAKYEHILVEGAGGWEVPVTETETMGDVAVDFGLPVLVVVNNRLGALNHTLLTVRGIRARGLRCAGLILNYPHDERDSASISNAAALRAIFPEIPVLEVMHGETEVDLTELEDLAEPVSPTA